MAVFKRTYFKIDPKTKRKIRCKTAKYYGEYLDAQDILRVLRSPRTRISQR